MRPDRKILREQDLDALSMQRPKIATSAAGGQFMNTAASTASILSLAHRRDGQRR